MPNKYFLYYPTLKHVKPNQLYYQLYYRFVARFFKPKFNVPFNTSAGVKFKEGIAFNDSLIASNTFKFLNLEKHFDISTSSVHRKIDWNFNEYGKLWTYNLNYFDFLQQENISKEEGLELVNDFCTSKNGHLDGYEPYPISLRGINWVKFLSKYEINDPRINQQLYNDYLRLKSNLEYHLLANHLIENAFSLLFGAYYFQDEKFYSKAKQLLKTQLKEQVLKDGAHYELSPMYHCIILHRVLDCYNLVSNNNWKNNELVDLLNEKVSILLGWLEAIQFKGGQIPMVNDSTIDIAPTPEALCEYAKRLKIATTSITLKESGYRKIEVDKIEAFFDVGQIAPSYQPGHSHADSLQIVVYSDGFPLIVDTGISTYDKNERRHLERSTSSHNTVTVNNLNSSEVWSGFRVAKRATVKIIKNEVDTIIASHNGYRSLGISCKREVKSLNRLEITDTVSGSKKDDLIQGHLHLHPNVEYQLKANTILLNEKTEIKFPEDTQLEVMEYLYCKGFNDLVPSKKIVYTFNEQITFSLKHS